MDEALGVREFLSRFHLPQLVRIASGEQQKVEQANLSKRASTLKRCSQLEQRSNWVYLDTKRADSSSEGQRNSLDSFKTFDKHPPLRLPRASLQANERPTNLVRPRSKPPDEQETEMGAGMGHAIRLAPPCKRPTLAKLSLEQPFLLYKAFKKVELCAYVIDKQNKLTEISGDPIYFPSNYTGWFSVIAPNDSQVSKPIESVEQLCSLAEVKLFMSRDELRAYRLPAKLSHMSKLKNNQLLPLAVNLENQQEAADLKLSGCQQEQGNSANKASSISTSVSDIRQVILGAGQTLMLCGLYEDVLPLIELRHLSSSKQQQRAATESSSPNVEFYTNTDISVSGMHQAEIFQNQLYATALHRGSQQQLQGFKPLSLREKPKLKARPSFLDPLAKKSSGKSKTSEQRKRQRYARCLVLSERSLAKLTGLPARVEHASDRKDKEQQEGEADCEQEDEEIEVLIPLEQRGRFYLCASNESILNELYYYQCNPPLKPNRVFRLNQIIYQLNLFKRLHSGVQPDKQHSYYQQQQQLHQFQGQLAQVMRLPLNLQLVFGPRPSNFSPSMFGLSSTMESYFSHEEHVAGHSISCKFNRNSLNNQQGDLLQKPEVSTNGRPICECAQTMLSDTSDSEDLNYGFFSAKLRVEQLLKRDVLLACTIKQNPLEQLELTETSNCTQTDSQRYESKPIGRRLMSLANEPIDFTEKLQKSRLSVTPNDDLKLVSLGRKSSLGRLQACKSLLSLNVGRKRKSRPNIPSCMLGAEQQLNYATGEQHDPSGELLPPPVGFERIVLLEFDCNERELKLARTFVEQSLPTSSIPDLVLNRVQFCHRNSGRWEQQLKLSYETLAQDFDAFKRQLAGPHHQAPVSQQIHSEELSTRRESRSSCCSIFIENCHSEGGTSSTSGCCSSGSGDEKQRPSSERIVKWPPITSEWRPSEPQIAEVPSTNPPLLKRLVERVFHKSSSNLSQSTLHLSNGNGSEPRKQGARERLATLMNAQKVHRRLMAGGKAKVAIDMDNSPVDVHLYESLECIRGRKQQEHPGVAITSKRSKPSPWLSELPKQAEVEVEESSNGEIQRGWQASLKRRVGQLTSGQSLLLEEADTENDEGKFDALEPISIELSYDNFADMEAEQALEDRKSPGVKSSSSSSRLSRRLSEWSPANSSVSASSSSSSSSSSTSTVPNSHVDETPDSESSSNCSNLYVNLTGFSGSLEGLPANGERLTPSRSRLVGRMERKLMKLRNRKSTGGSNQSMGLTSLPLQLQTIACNSSRVGQSKKLATSNNGPSEGCSSGEASDESIGNRNMVSLCDRLRQLGTHQLNGDLHRGQWSKTRSDEPTASSASSSGSCSNLSQEQEKSHFGSQRRQMKQQRKLFAENCLE